MLTEREELNYLIPTLLELQPISSASVGIFLVKSEAIRS